MTEIQSVRLPPEALPRVASTIAALVHGDRDRFLSALELGYLAASADGLDARERDVLASVLERATGSTIDHGAFEAHFADLDATVAALGRRERLARSAADFDSEEARQDAVRLAALIAMADGALHPPELAVLTELAAHFEWPTDRVRELVAGVVAQLGGER